MNPPDRANEIGCGAAARDRAPWRDDRGVAMFGVVLLTAVMLALGIIGVEGARLGLQITQNDVQDKLAMAAAEAGLAHSLGAMRLDFASTGFNDGFLDELAGAGTGGSLAAVGTTLSLHGRSYRFRSFGGTDSDGYYVRVIDNTDEKGGANEPAKDEDLIVRVQSVGRFAAAERVVEGLVRARALFPLALFGDDWVEFGGTARTDSYDSRVGPYPNGSGDHGDVGSNGYIDLGGFAVVNGDAEAAGVVVDDHGGVRGDKIEGADPVPLPPVPACGPPYSSGAGILGALYNAATGELEDNHADVILPPGTYCFASLAIKRDLVITGPTVIFMTGEFDISSGAVLNPGKPTELQIFSSSTDVSKGIKLTGGPGARASVYAPRTAVHLSGGGEFWGSLVGKTITMQGNGFFHYDEALGLLAARDIDLLSWREVRRD